MNSFVGLDTTDITGGIFSATDLLKENNLICFVLTVVKTFAPNSLSSIFATVALPLNFLFKVLDVPLLSLACPAFNDLKSGGKPLWEVLLGKFPGAKRAGSAF